MTEGENDSTTLSKFNINYTVFKDDCNGIVSDEFDVGIKSNVKATTDDNLNRDGLVALYAWTLFEIG